MPATFYGANDKKKEKIGVDDQLLLAQDINPQCRA